MVKLRDLQLKMDFVRITGIVYYLIGILTFNFGPMAKFKTARKFISPFLVLINLLIILNKLCESLKEENIFMIFLGIILVITFVNLFAKAFTICYYEEEIMEHFNWMEGFFYDNSQPIFTRIKAKLLEKTNWVLKIFLKIFISSTVFSVFYGIIFYIANDTPVIKIPYLSETANLWLQLVLIPMYIPLYGIPIVCFGGMGIIFIGVLRLFNECIEVLEDDIPEEETPDEGFPLILHKMHCEIYNKFCVFQNIFFYPVFFDIILITGSCILTLVIIRLYPYYTFFYVVFIILTSQILIYCIFGQFIFSETERISDSLYLSKWYDFNKKDKRTFLLMMMMSSRPFGLKVGGMYDLNLFLFVQIMKLIFSYCGIIYAFL